MVTIIIDGKDYLVEEGLSLLKVLRSNSKDIPSLCYHPDVKEHHQYCPSCAKLFFKGTQPMPSR